MSKQTDKQIIKHKVFKNYLHYYGIYFAGAIILIALILFFFSDYQKKRPDERLFVLAVDYVAASGGVEEYRNKLAETLGLNKDQCIIETGAAGRGNSFSAATAGAYMRDSRVDILIAREDEFNQYACSGYMTDLTNTSLDLTEEQDETRFYAKTYDYSEAGPVEEFPFAPHDSEDAGWYGIYIGSGSPFQGYVAGILRNAPHSTYAQEAMNKISG